MATGEVPSPLLPSTPPCTSTRNHKAVAHTAEPGRLRLADQTDGHIKRSGNTESVEDRSRHLQVIEVAVVESDRHCSARERPFSLQKEQNVIERHRVELTGEQFHMASEDLGGVSDARPDPVGV